MAKSKTGGSRAYLRGRVGSDVYSIGVDSKGKKQQVVRSLAESVKNPQTLAQMRGRMIMSTIMQAVSAMRPIIDHSFDNVPAGQPAISEFIKRNYALVKDDVAAHSASGNKFGLNRFQEKGAKQGAYVISVGSALEAKNIVIDGTAKTLTIALGNDVTIGGLKAALDLTINDYFTACALLASGKFIYERFHINGSLADDTTISSENIAEVFNLEGNTSVAIALVNSNVVATLSEFSANAAIITSRKENSGYVHSGATLAEVANPAYTADVALPTYPTGKERFLNGGGEESGDVPFVPEPFSCALTGVTADGQAWAKGDKTLSGTHSEVDVIATIDNYEAGHNIRFGESLSDSTQFEGTQATYTLADYDSPAGSKVSGTLKLFVDGVAVETWGTLTFTKPEE